MSETRTMRVSRPEAGLSLLDFLSRHLGISRKQAKRSLDARAVFVNRRRVWMARHPLEPGDVVEVLMPRPATAPAPRLPVLYEDDLCLVINKPAGLTTNGPGSAEVLLQQERGPALRAVHRLDRDTTGCNLFARARDAEIQLIDLFAQREVNKVYRALATGLVPDDLTAIRSPVDGLEAVTVVRVLRSNRQASYIEAQPETGRTHQIRKHLRAAGHPLVGDRVYATGETATDALRAIPRQMLHAWKLNWRHPVSGQLVAVEAPLPADFRQALRALRLG